MVMSIKDDVARLRQQFGGMWSWMHAAAVVCFIAPYVWFLAVQSIRAEFTQDDNSITLLTAVLRYIWNGGRDWQTGWDVDYIAISLFASFAVYNAARLALLWKTKTLEMQQIVSGLPVMFSLRDHTRWLYCYDICNGGFWFSVAIAIANSLRFMMMRVPVEVS